MSAAEQHLDLLEHVRAGDVGVDVDVLAGDPQWQERALCAQTDPEAFFPEKGGSTRHAKQICSACWVQAECLDYALAHDERFGIWGGLSERERRRLRRGELRADAQDADGLPNPQVSHPNGTALCADPIEVIQ
jgi:WhiB family redox-sensing transcriptional regulator